MPEIELDTLLGLVGELVDSEEAGSASQRFREYLQTNVHGANDLRDYVEHALHETGGQYNKALQDLINHLGHLLGFEIVYGRYRGVRGEVGFDGLWRSPAGWSIVIEAKTTDVYAVKTAPLLGYINSLVSDGRIEQPEKCLGLYVYGRFDAGASQLENAITVEGRGQSLRVVSVDALLNLFQLKQEYNLSHRTILRLLLPAPVRIDPLINLVFDVVAEEKQEGPRIPEGDGPKEAASTPKVTRATENKRHVILSRIDKDYTGQSIVSLNFDGRRQEVHSWKGTAVALFSLLCDRDRVRFEDAALSIVGRKRPYFTRDKGQLRQPATIPDIDLFFEANLSANSMVKLCYTVLDRMGLPRSIFTFEVES
jgi:negative regulator of replication initiation